MNCYISYALCASLTEEHRTLVSIHSLKPQTGLSGCRRVRCLGRDPGGSRAVLTSLHALFKLIEKLELQRYVFHVSYCGADSEGEILQKIAETVSVDQLNRRGAIS